jgi:PrcB C-terminal
VPVDFSVVATGQMSGYGGERRVELVSNEGEWRAAWGLIGEGRPLPEVNFDTRAVVVVYQGRKPTGGYGIEVAGVRRVGTVLAIKVNERRPASEDITTQALTSPYVAATIPRPPSGAQVRFDEAAAGGQKKVEPKGVTKPRARTPRRRARRGR